MTVAAPPAADIAALSFRVSETPGVAVDSSDPPADARRRLIPTIALAHASGGRLVTAWIRPAHAARVTVLLGGLEPDHLGPREAAIAFPPGTRGIRVDNAKVDALLGRIAGWIRCEGRFDALTTGDPQGPSAPGRGFDDYVALLPDALARIVVAIPAQPDAVDHRIDDLSRLVAVARGGQQGLGSAHLQFEQAEAELRHLEAWAPLGLWQVEVWVGAGSSRESRAIVGLLAGSADVADMPVRLRPAGPTPAPDWAAPFMASAETVAALTRLPTRELPGLRVVDPPAFDVTPEVRGRNVLGEVLNANGQACGTLGVTDATLNRHVFVCGATGSGKSQTVRRLLEQLTRPQREDDVPWLVIEPAKAEYRRMAGRLAARGGQVTVIRPGDPTLPPACLNPLEPTTALVGEPPRPVTFPLQTHLDLVKALFMAAFEPTEPFPQILASALTRSYEVLGWNLALSRSFDTAPGVRPRYPTLQDLQNTALEVVEGAGYGREVRENVRGFVNVRIGSLRLGTTGRFFEGGHPLDLQALVGHNVVLEIEDIGDDKDKAFVIGLVLIRLFELARLRFAQGSPHLRHVIVLEEAHRLLRAAEPNSPAAHAVEIFANLLAEVRAYGTGIVVAEQIPSKIIVDVVKNSALKVMHRLPAADDRELVGATMNLEDDQSRHVVSLPAGRAAVHAERMDRPLLVDVDASAAALETRAAPLLRPQVGTAGAACAVRCRDEPCTLDEIITSQQLAEEPELTLFGEITVLAHLVGEPMGTLSAAWVRELRSRTASLGQRRLRCALGQIVDRAVRVRSRHIQRFYDPAKLCTVAVEALVDQLKHLESDRLPDPRWHVGEYRWHDAVRALSERPDGAEIDRPHPLTDVWRRRGLALDDGGWETQRRQAIQANMRLRTPHRATFLGEPSALEAATAACSSAATPADRLRRALRFLELPTDWPAFRLYRDAREVRS